MTDIVDVPAAPVVAPFPALGSNTYNDEAYAAGLSLPGLSAGLHAIAVATRTNALAGQGLVIAANTSAADAAQARDEALAAAVAAATSANFVGAWSGLTGPLAKGANVYYAPQNWQLLEDVADVAAHVPGVSAVWVPALQLKTVGGQSLVGTGNLELSGGIEATVVQRAFAAGEERMISLLSPVDGAALVSVQREIPQLGVSSNYWQSSISSGDFIFENFSKPVTITIGATVDGVAPVTLASGAWTEVDKGLRLEGAGGVAVIQSYAGSVAQAFVVTAFTDASASAGTWSLFALSVQDGNLRLGTKAGRNYAAQEAVYVQASPPVPGRILSFSEDGMYMFAGAPNAISRYTLIAPFDISNWTAQASVTGGSIAVFWRDGYKVVKGGERIWAFSGINTSLNIAEFRFSAPYSTALSAGTSAAAKTMSGNDLSSGYAGLAVTPDGLNLYTCRDVSGVFTVQRWRLTAAWDLTTMPNSPTQQVIVSGVDGILEVDAEGRTLYLRSTTATAMVPLAMPTANNLDGATLGAAIAFSAGTVGHLTSMVFADSGRRMYFGSVSAGPLAQFSISGTVRPVGINYPAIYASGVDTEFWTSAKDLAVTGDGGRAYYAMSSDGRSTWQVSTRSDGLRSIARLQGGAWQVNANATYTGTTWVDATTNTELAAIRQAVTDTAANRMTKTSLVAGRSYDLASIVSGSTTTALIANTGSSGSQWEQNGALIYAPDGQRFHTFDATQSSGGDIRVREWTPTEAWGIAVSASTVRTLGGTTTASGSNWTSRYFNAQWSSDGVYLFIAAYNAGAVVLQIQRYTTTTPGRIAGISATFTASIYVPNLPGVAAGGDFNTNPSCMCITDDGSRIFLADKTHRIHQFNMATPFGIGSLTHGGSFPTGLNISSSTMRISEDGRSAFVASNLNVSSIREFALSVPFDITTAVLAATHSGLGLSGESFCFGQSGSYVYTLSGGYTAANSRLLRASSPLGGLLPLPTLGDALDIAVTLGTASALDGAYSSGLRVTYDANTTHEILLPGTHYTFTQPSSERVLFKSLINGNLKVRIA